HLTIVAVLAALLGILAACGNDATAPPATNAPLPSPPGGGSYLSPTPAPTLPLPTAPPIPTAAGPAHITLQHILIGFKGSAQPTNATRTMTEAQQLATSLLAQAKGGADFDALMKANSDDPGPGIYSMANTGQTPDTTNGEVPRDQMIPAFGDVGFKL